MIPLSVYEHVQELDDDDFECIPFRKPFQDCDAGLCAEPVQNFGIEKVSFKVVQNLFKIFQHLSTSLKPVK